MTQDNSIPQLKRLIAISTTEFKARVERGEKPELPTINEMCRPGDVLVIEQQVDGEFVARRGDASVVPRLDLGVALFPVLNPPMPVVASARALGEQPMIWIVESAS